MKVGVVVTARMGSTRLNAKHFYPIANKPALLWLLERILDEFKVEINSNSVEVYIATGSYENNARFAELLSGLPVRLFHGDEDNIPARHFQATQRHGLDALLSIDGDDLLCSVQAMRAVYSQLVEGVGLVKTVGLPLGMNAWGYSTQALSKALANSISIKLDTGWGRIFDSLEPEIIKIECPNADLIRATLDYPDDAVFFDTIACSVKDFNSLNSLELVDIVMANDYHKINSHLNNEYWENFNMGIIAETESDESLSYSGRLNAVIPGGAHTYSRGDDQYPSNAPQILYRGKGCNVWSPNGQQFLDYGMALRSVTIGYAEPDINAAAISAIEMGNSLTRASVIELHAAEKLVSLIDSVDMVKFTKNGSTATSAAVKLSRAYTGREIVARCAQHPFFSFDDWFIGSTPIKKGIPENIINQTKTFEYNNIDSLEHLIEEFPNQIACVILEPAALDCPATAESAGGCCGCYPCTRHVGKPVNYLQKVQSLCKKNGIVFILDETITGFRWDIKGAQHTYNIQPDLTTFGKGMANGFSVAAVAGRREIMELGAINTIGAERLFLLSTTHGAEMSGLAAFLATTEFIQRNDVISHLWQYGTLLKEMINEESARVGIQKFIYAGGPAANPYYMTVKEDGSPWLELRTLFSQEMIRKGVLMPWLAVSYRHGSEELQKTKQALNSTFAICANAISDGVSNYVEGPIIKPVFRKFN